MIIKKYSEMNNEIWDKFVEDSFDAWFYHKSDYINYSVSQGNINQSFAILTDAGELVGICPLYSSYDTRYSTFFALKYFQRCIMYFLRKVKIKGPWDYKILSTGFSGPAISSKIGLKGKKRVLKEIFSHLELIGYKEKADEIHVRYSEMAKSNTGSNRPGLASLWNNRIISFINIVPRTAIILDLEETIEKLRSNMDEDCRAEINRAIKEGCTTLTDPENRIQRYHNIHHVSWNRTMGHAHPLDHFLQMDSVFKENMHIFIAQHECKDVAGVLLHTYKESAMYWGGCSLLEGQKVKANNFLLFESIKWCKERGYKWFFVGVFDAFPGLNLKEYKVGQYKAQFSSKHVEALEGKVILTKRALNYDNHNQMRLLQERKNRVAKKLNVL